MNSLYTFIDMPQLVKGGKYIFGWTIINNDRLVRIPDEAFVEYNFNKDEEIILMSGSRTSGGFSLIKKDALETSEIGQYLKDSIGYQSESGTFSIPRFTIITSGRKLIYWSVLEDEKSFRLSNEYLELSGLRTGSKLLVGRGSGLGPAFIEKGTIYVEALKHKNIVEY